LSLRLLWENQTYSSIALVTTSPCCSLLKAMTGDTANTCTWFSVSWIRSPKALRTSSAGNWLTAGNRKY